MTSEFENARDEAKKELWKKIKGYDYSEVSNLGRVRSLDRRVKAGCSSGKEFYIFRKGHLRKTHKEKTGYISVVLRENNIVKKYLVHRLVAQAFIKDNKSKKQINHINGLKHDNRAVNLEWSTQKENTIHAYKNKLIKPAKGKKHYMSKLNKKEFIKIKNMYKKGNISQAKIAEMYSVSQTYISLIIRNKVWGLR